MTVQQVNSNDFIGRRKEVEVFTQWLQDPDSPPILYFHDSFKEDTKKGGIGKTWLLRKCIALIEEQYQHITFLRTDFFNAADRDGVAIAERTARALQSKYPRWIPETFEKALKEYRDAVRVGMPEAADIRARLGDAFTADLYLLEEEFQRTNSYLLLFFDTFELIEQNLTTAVLRLYQLFPDTYGFKRIRFVIAGRNELDYTHPNWVERQREVSSHSLSPFTYEEMLEYLSLHAYIDKNDFSVRKLKTLYQYTEGRPILIGLVADILRTQVGEMSLDMLISSSSDFEANLVEQINSFDNPIKWAILFMAHIYHRFNADVLDLIINQPGLRDAVQGITFQQLVDTLPTLSFVRYPGSKKDFVLHDEMRRLVNLYCWERQDIDKRIRRELSRLAVRYYQHQMSTEKDDQARRNFTIEMLFHLFYTNIDEGFRLFREQFKWAMDFSNRAFGRSLFQEARKFESQMSLEQRYSMKLTEARLLREEERPEAAIPIYQAVEHAYADWFKRDSAEIFYEMGYSYLRASKFAEAMLHFSSALEIEKRNTNKARYAEILNFMGYIHRLQGRLTEAITCYEESLVVQRNVDNVREYANILNNIGNVYRLQGKMQEALRTCKIALQLRRKLFGEGKASELQIGWSLSTMGHIYNARGEVVPSESCYREAFEIYSRIGDKRGIAATYNNLGQILMTQGQLEKAYEYFKQANHVSSGVDTEAYINSLNKQGLVLGRMGKAVEAIGCFEQALQKAREVGDSYHETENQIDLAEALEQAGQSSKQTLLEAKRNAYLYDYHYLSGRIAEIQGNAEYRAGRYRDAFKHYRVACRNMALYSPLEFEKFLRKLDDLLIETPAKFLPGAIDSLLGYWFDLKLDETYPELVKTCEDMSKHLTL